MRKTGARRIRLLWLLLILLVVFVALSLIYQYQQLNGKIKIGVTPTPPVSISSIKYIEVEPNDSFDSASPLKPGYETQGTLASGRDVDIYWFQIDQPSNVTLTLKSVPKEYGLVIYDVNKTQIAASSRVGFTESRAVLTIQKPGKYYIKMVANYTEVTNSPYTISLSIQPFFE